MKKDHWWNKEPWKGAPWYVKLRLLFTAVVDAFDRFFSGPGQAGP
jgi:hypothetical protein